ncbi:piggyBac transposable element-derived protein 4-like [Solea solea]|uniref:piggyBac transposable element-derived protein 4-like n=1 Tax=Solea solea TaxID=90069 RepID=UPI00272C9E32|nr:piggyBac transposable element-derived protein 4-like [Solea solea]
MDVLMNDSGSDVVPEDSSSEEEDLIQPKFNNNGSSYWDCSRDSDCHMSSSDSENYNDEDYQPPKFSLSARPPLSRGRPSRHAPLTPPPQPMPTEKISPEQSQPSKKRRLSVSADETTEEEGERWNNREEEDQKPDPLSFTPARSPGPRFNRSASWSPLSLFQLYFSKSVVQTIIDNTNANAAKRIKAGKKFLWTTMTLKDFYIFMAIIVFSGLVHVHHRGDYWKRQWPYNFPFPREKMSWNRFEAILWSLHLSDPKDDEDNDRKKNTAGYDRLFKIKPLYADITTACKAHFQPYQNICMNERMVAPKAQISTKQHMRSKPTKWGYKLFVLADATTGYTWNFSVYTGKLDKSQLGLSYTSVVDLLPFSMLGEGYTLYVDNFYASPALFRDLHKKHIGCCGTIRKNCIGFPHTNSNDFPQKPERGDIRWMRKDCLLFVKWADTREVTVCSTVHEAFSGKTVQRRVAEDEVWSSKEVPVPDAVMEHNKNMGGVDLSDAFNGYYSSHHKATKWYKTFFYHFMDIAVMNSFLLYEELSRYKFDPSAKEYTQKTFRETLAADMLSFAEGLAPQPPPASSSTLTCMPRYYGSDATASRRYCRRCQDAGVQRVKTPIYCRKCNVSLCLTSKKNCFERWHDTR